MKARRFPHNEPARAERQAIYDEFDGQFGPASDLAAQVFAETHVQEPGFGPAPVWLTILDLEVSQAMGSLLNKDRPRYEQHLAMVGALACGALSQLRKMHPIVGDSKAEAVVQAEVRHFQELPDGLRVVLLDHYLAHLDFGAMAARTTCACQWKSTGAETRGTAVAQWIEHVLECLRPWLAKPASEAS